MRHTLKYVNYYKLSLLRGCLHNLRATAEHTLRMEGSRGGYLSRMFDTGEDDATFNRLLVEGDFEGLKLEIIVAATNDREAVLDDMLQPLDQYLNDPAVPLRKKIQVLTHLPHIRMVNTADILLHELRGRYVWICVAMYAAGETTGTLTGMRLEFPKYTFLEYFPEIYRENAFFERYLAVFQSAFLDEERKIDDMPLLLDYTTAPDDMVEQLAGWLGIDNGKKTFSPAQLRMLIREIDLFQGGKGTRHTLERMLHMVTGITPRIVEYFQWSELRMPAHTVGNYRRLYGGTGDDFCVILDVSWRKEPLPLGENELNRLIESYSPIGARFRVVYLDMCNHMDTHCYLDVNSALSVPEIAATGKDAFGSHMIMG